MLGVKGLAYWTKPPYFTLWKVFVYYVVLQLVRKFLREGFQMIFGEVPNRKHTTSTRSGIYVPRGELGRG